MSSANAENELRVLGRTRTRIGLALTASVVAIYFGFIGSVAFAKPFLGRQIVPGLSVGILFGAFVIVAAWLLTWIYVRWTNVKYDPTLHALRDGTSRPSSESRS